MSKDEVKLKDIESEASQTVFGIGYLNLFYKKADSFSDSEKAILLKAAVVFLNYGDIHLRKMGYRIVVRYCNLFNDYTALYDVSMNFGYMPIAKFIEGKHLEIEYVSEKFFNAFFSAHIETYKLKNYYQSYGQRILANYTKQAKNDFVLVAPTSYGKSELLIARVLDNKEKRNCIIVPTKALLAQTKRRLLDDADIRRHFKRIITHPDMFKDDDKGFVAVLTQERLLRLLQKNVDFHLDILLLDEAHNLMKSDQRAILLAQVLLILRKRNKKTAFNFFTPFISESKNLELSKGEYKLDLKSTTEVLKVERFYSCDFRKGKTIEFYDQFLNTFHQTSPKIFKDEMELIQTAKADKNIIYLNRPKDIEHFALKLTAGNIQLENELEEIYNSISDFLHSDYNLLKCIKNGVVYHHGGMPDLIRLYVENVFSSNNHLSFIVTNSTLLEGVNIPAEKMFLLTTSIGRRNFNKSEFKNLIGRVCRFSEIFNPKTGHLRMLEPEIYLCNSEYAPKRANVQTFLKQKARVSVTAEDQVENVLVKDNLNNQERQKATDALEVLENIEPNTVDVPGIRYVKSEIGKLCYKNNITEFDIQASEKRLVRNLAKWEHPVIKSEELLLQAIFEIFVSGIEINAPEIARLENASARRFYTMVFSWRTKGSSYKQLIGSFLGYWKDLDNPVIYAGSRWGEIALEDFTKKLYVDLRDKSEVQKVNLAIVRIKEEQDFVDNHLIKFVEILQDLDLLEKKFYERIKYGSSDKRVICLLKNGFSIELARTITKVIYSNYVEIDADNDEIEIKKGILDVMKDAGENRILLFEVSYHIN